MPVNFELGLVPTDLDIPIKYPIVDAPTAGIQPAMYLHGEARAGGWMLEPSSRRIC